MAKMVNVRNVTFSDSQRSIAGGHVIFGQPRLSLLLDPVDSGTNRFNLES
jgi:hypothetical protein